MYHPDIRLLRCFAYIAESGSVTRAADRLNLTQPTVSGQIKELEKALGFPLFYRTTRSVELTQHGKRLLPMVRIMLDRADDIRREVGLMQVEQAQHFRLGAALYSLDLPTRIALLEDFTAAMPNVSFSIDGRLQTDQVPDLLGERLDASLLLGIATSARYSEAKHEECGAIINEIQYPASLQRVVLQTKKIGLVVPRHSPLAAEPLISRAALKGQKVAMLSEEHGHALIDPLEFFLRDCGAEVIHLSEGNALAIERYAERLGICAIGIGWFPSPPGLVHREVEDMDFCIDFALVLGAAPNRAAQRFFEFTRDWQTARQGREPLLAA